MSLQPIIQRIKVQGSIQASRLGLHVLPNVKSLVQMMSDNKEKIRRCPIVHEPRVVADEEAHVPRVFINHSLKNNGTLHLSGF
jgi:hypothetical protein